MSAKHATPEWRRTVRIIRTQVRRAWERGDEVICWRHGHVIPEGAPYDVGHLDPFGGESPSNAAPECRAGNRSHGGRIGAAITNSKTNSNRPKFQGPSWA